MVPETDSGRVPLEPAPLAAPVVARPVAAVVAGDDDGEVLEFRTAPQQRP